MPFIQSIDKNKNEFFNSFLAKILNEGFSNELIHIILQNFERFIVLKILQLDYESSDYDLEFIKVLDRSRHIYLFKFTMYDNPDPLLNGLIFYCKIGLNLIYPFYFEIDESLHEEDNKKENLEETIENETKSISAIEFFKSMENIEFGSSISEILI